MSMPALPTITRPERSELLMPAGSLTKLKTAILYGADAVYAGTPDLSLRTQSSFSLEELVEGVKFVHEHGKRIYLTLNLFTHNSDIEKLPKFIETIRTVKPDGVIIADPGVFQFVRQHAPELGSACVHTGQCLFVADGGFLEKIKGPRSLFWRVKPVLKNWLKFVKTTGIKLEALFKAPCV